MPARRAQIAGDGRGVLGGTGPPPGVHGAGAVQQQADGRRVVGRGLGRGRQPQRLDDDLGLAAHVQRRAAGGEHGEVRRRLDQRGDLRAPPPGGARGCRGPAAAAGPADPLDDVLGDGRAGTPRVASTASAMAGSTADVVQQRRQLDEDHAVGVPVPASAATASARRVLPTPPVPVRVTSRCSRDEAADPAHVVVAAEQGGGRDRQVPRAGGGGVGGGACGPGAGRHRRDQAGAVGLRERQRRRQGPEGVRVGPGAGAPLQGADRVGAQAGPRASSSCERPARSRSARRTAASEVVSSSVGVPATVPSPVREDGSLVTG